MTPFEFFDAVKHVQSEFDVDRLTLGGFNHWMIVRLLMLGSFSQDAAQRTAEIAGQPGHSRMIDNPLTQRRPATLSPISYRRRIIGGSAMLFEPPSLRTERTEVVFFELPVDYTQIIDGEAVNRIADGFVEAFGSRVRKMCRFFHDAFTHASRVDPTYVFLAPPTGFDIPTDERARFARVVYDLCAFMRSEVPKFAPAPSDVFKNVSLVLSQATAHEAWLRELKPQLVAFQCFVSFEKMALLVACRRLGIPTMEVQHGFCDVNSIFNNIPASTPNGRSIVTDIFWSWGEHTMNALKGDSGFIANGVDVVLGGDVWGALAASRATADSQAFLERIGAAKYTRRIVVGHQIEAMVHSGSRNSLVLEFLLDAMKQGPQSWLWMIRIHPRSSHLIEPIKAALAAEGIRNCEVEHTSLETIEVVMEAADVFLTGFSVSALEANTLNKPVILLDPVGKRLFGELVEEGVFKYATTARELIGLIEALKPPSRDAGYYRRDLDHSRRMLDSLLQPRVLELAG